MSKSKLWNTILPYVLITPAFIILRTFVIYPIFNMIYLSFFEWNLVSPKIFVGLNNFIYLFKDKVFWQIIGNSFNYTFYYVVLSIGLSLPLAFYLQLKVKGSEFLQTILFAPHILSLVSVAFIWMWLMDSDYGLLNYILSLFKIAPVGWLSNRFIALFSVIFVSVWKSLGYNTIIMLSAMKNIPVHLYEAAKLDKASALKIFTNITLPLISPTLFFLTLMNIISAFKVFETINVMTAGGPVNSTNTFVYAIYLNSFQYYNKVGEASAIGVILMVIIGVCTALYFKAMGSKVHYR